MFRSTKLAISGVVVFVVSVGAGLAIDEYRRRDEVQFHVACTQQHRGADKLREQLKDRQNFTFEEAIGMDYMVCEREHIPSAFPTAGTLGGGALFLALPYLWYAFLRRVRELRDAIVGSNR